jgi:pyruvate kinase
VRLAAKYRPGVPILVLTKNQAVANACSMIRAAVPLVLGEQAATLERSGLVRLVRVQCGGCISWTINAVGHSRIMH